MQIYDACITSREELTVIVSVWEVVVGKLKNGSLWRHRGEGGVFRIKNVRAETGEFGGYDEMERKRRRDLGLVRGR